jgi:hypothetical protein
LVEGSESSQERLHRISIQPDTGRYRKYRVFDGASGVQLLSIPRWATKGMAVIDRDKVIGAGFIGSRTCPPLAAIMLVNPTVKNGSTGNVV